MAVTRRVALLVATSEYTDPRLRALRAPTREVRELREILLSQGDFDEVETVVEGTKSAIERKIAWLFVNRGPRISRCDLIPVRIDGQQASDSGTYPFWEMGFAYTYGHPQPDSLAASFLNHLLDDASTMYREQQPR